MVTLKLRRLNRFQYAYTVQEDGVTEPLASGKGVGAQLALIVYRYKVTHIIADDTESETQAEYMREKFKLG